MDYGLDDIKMILAPCALIICILWDTAFGAAKDYLDYNIPSWVPSNLFVLSAVTIQILGYVDVQRVNVLGPSNAKDMQELVDNQLRMDAARLTMCVFVGCLLPGMATVGSTGRWSNVAALFLTLFFHIATEIYALQNVTNSQIQSEAGPWFVSSGVVLLVGASSLLLLLGFLILYGKSVRDQRPRIAENISEDVENQGEKWKRLTSEVIKSWVAARAWKTKYFIMTSVYSPAAGVIVTICVAVMAAKLGCRSSLLLSRNNKHGEGNLITFYLQCIFILVGWILMLCRWFKAALYCAPSTDIHIFNEIMNVMFMPGAVVVSPLSHSLAYTLFHPLDLPIDCLDCLDRFDWRLYIFSTLLGFPLLPLWVLIFSIRHFKWRDIIIISLLSAVPLLPLCVLTLAIAILCFFCFICCFLSLLVFGNPYVQQLCKLDRKVDSVKEYTSILEDMNFSEKVQHTFWIMNKKPFDRIKRRIDEHSESCTGLLSIISKHESAEQHPFLGDSTNTKGLLLRQRRMATISDISLAMIRSSEILEDFKDVLVAYRETRDVLKFVDYPENIVVDPLNIFGKLNFQGFMHSIDCEERMQMLESKMKERSSTSLRGHRPERVEKHEAQTLEWIYYRIIYPITPRAVRTGLHVDRLSMNELKEMLCTLLCHIIVSAVLEAPDVLLKCTKQWAGNCDERKIEGAIQIAGKVSRFLEKMGDAATDAELEIAGKLIHFFEMMKAEETRDEGPSEITTA